VLGLTWAALVEVPDALAATPKRPIAPFGFQLPGSNGYSITVSEGAGADVSVDATRPGRLVSYSFPGRFGSRSASANLQGLGRLALRFHRTRGVRSVKFCDERTPTQIQTGYWTGNFRFRGEGGFTQVHARRIAGKPSAAFLDFFCPPRLPIRDGDRVALHVDASPPGHHHTSLVAIDNGPGERPYIEAATDKPVGKVGAYRSVSFLAPVGTFSFEPSLTAATLVPPAPFIGSANFNRSGDAATWQGDLVVNFPGAPGFSLTGPGYSAGLYTSRFKNGHLG
jgi:hypothetical protein